MARTTASEVEAIIEVDVTIGLTPFITAANSLVTQCCTNLDTDYSEDQLNIIETWLSAHFYTVRDMRAERERAGTVEEKFQSRVDLGFATSHYGQMAMTLDFQGGLSALNEKIKKGTVKPISMTWLGTDPDDS